MTWNTPLGHRVLDDREVIFFSSIIASMTMDILESDPGETVSPVGIELYDNLLDSEKIVMLDYVRTFLFDETSDIPPSTAISDATVAAIYEYLSEQVDFEDDTEDKVFQEMLEETATEYGWSKDPDRLDEALELLFSRVLHNDDYTLHNLPADAPEASALAKRRAMIPDDYFVAPPADEPPAFEMVETIRRLLSGV